MNRIGKKIVPLVLVFIMIIGNLITGLNFVRAQENENNPNVIQNIDYEFDMRWSNVFSNDVKDYHYEDETRKKLVFTPIDNLQKTATIAYTLKLKNDANTVMPKGAIKIKVPAYIFKDWNGGSQTRGKYYEYEPVLKWQIPKAPDTSTVSDFNYVDNGDGTLTLSNFKEVSGSATLSFEQAFIFTPSLVKLDKDNSGEESGILNENVKSSIFIDAKTPINEERSIKLSVQSKNIPTKLSLKQADLDSYKGVYFDWQDQWGKKPTDADDYFYVIWYADVQRGAYPKIPFNYEIHQEDDGVGGKIVGVKKDTYNGNIGFVYQTWENRYTDYSYNNITKGDENLFKQPGLWPDIKNTADRQNGKVFLYGFDNYYSGNETRGHYARFSILKKYPKTIIENEKKKGTDLSKDGFSLPNKMSLTDTLQNGVVKKHEIVETDAKIYIHKYNGYNNIWKYDTASTLGLSEQAAAQDFLLQGLDITFNYRSNVKSTFTIHTTTSSPKEPTVENGEAKVTPYTTEVDDGKLYYSTEYKNYEKLYADEFQNFKELKEGDATYKSIYFSLNEYNGKKTEGGWYKIVNPSKEYEKYKPIDIFVKYIGENEYKKLGKITFDKDGKQNYLSEDGETEIKNVTADNPVTFPKNVANIKYSHISTFFESDLYAMPMMVLHPTNNLKELIQKDIDNKQKTGKYYTSISSDAKAKVFTEDGQTINSNTTSQRMRLSTKWLKSLTYSTHYEKSANNLVDDVKNGIQTIDVTLQYGNLMNLWDSGSKEFEYIDKYVPKKVAFYDLLPAGTYIKPNSVVVRGGFFHPTLDDNIAPSNYTVEYKENWEGSGQTMMIIVLNVPQYNREFYKRYSNHGSRFFVHYKLVNTYNNISDRGNSVINTVGIKNLSDDVVVHSNAKNSSIHKKEFYKKLIGEDYSKWNLSQTTMNYNPVTVKQAGVTKKVANDHDNEFKEKTNIFVGNKYTYNLSYAMSSETRADNIILYDVLENGNDKESSEWKGKLDWIDLSAIKQKPAYGYVGENCNPEVYVSKLDPAKIKLDVDDKSIWEKVELDKISQISGITAVAIDCRKTNKGNSFVLDRGMSLHADLHMISPNDNAIDGKKAVNKTDILARIFNESQPNQSDIAKVYEASAKVIAKKMNISLTKTSNPESGTKEKPTIIENKVGDSIQYTLKITNNDTDLDVRNIRMDDLIPQGLTPDIDNILVTCEALKINKAKISSLTQIGVKQTNQNLEFVINNLPKGANIVFEVPTKIEKEFIRSTLFDNTAKITSVEGFDKNIVSETTHHKAEKYYKLNYVVIPDANHGIPANSKTPKEVTGIEYEDIKNLEKPLSTNETTDNTGIKGIWTFTGWGEKENDIDNSLLNKVKIIKDTTVYGKWVFNPTKEIVVEKKWADAKLSKDGKETILKKAKPETVTIELYRNDEKIKEQKLTADINWKYTFKDLLISRKKGETPYKYTVKEVGLDKDNEIMLSGSWYKAKVEGNENQGFVVTNTILANFTPMEVPFRTIKVTKEWKNHKGDLMPESKIKDNKVTVELYRDGEATGKSMELSAKNNWTVNFEKLPVSKTLGSKIYTYTVKEKGLSKNNEIVQNDLVYKSSVDGNQKDGFKVTNTLVNPNISVLGEKHWNDANNQDGIRPDSIVVHLYANQKDTNKSFVVSKNTNWKYNFDNLPTYDENGDKISYTVVEDAVKDYTSKVMEAKVDEKGNIIYDILNSHKPIERSIKINKFWVDNNNKKQLRPKEIKIKLIADGDKENPIKEVVVKSDENGIWETKITNLPVNKNGKEIVYTVVEDKVENYTGSILGTMEDGFIVTNTIEGKQNVEITKKWIGKTLDFIEVILKQDGKEYTRMKITSATNWKYIFKDIPIYDNNGHEYKYELEEIKIDGYVSKVDKINENTYQITNEQLIKPNKKEAPKTDDSIHTIITYLMLFINSLLVIVLLKTKLIIKD